MVRVLIVDDMKEIHSSFAAILSGRAQGHGLDSLVDSIVGADEGSASLAQLEYDMVSVYQGAEAVELVRAELREGRRFDLAFVDMRMPPGINGIETIKQLWELDSELEVVLCTAYADYSFDDIRSELGSTDKFLLLKKPFDAIEIEHLTLSLSKKRALQNEVQMQLDELKCANDELLAGNKEIKKSQDKALSLERQLAQSQKMEMVGTLAGGLAHDFNNVLAGITGTIQLIQMKCSKAGVVMAEDPYLSRLEIIEECTDRARGLVSNLLSFARKYDYDLRAFDLREPVKGVVKIISNSFDKIIDIEMHLPNDPLFVRADANILEQVLLNLCVNARDAIGEQDGSIVITAETFEASADFIKEHPEAQVGCYHRLSVRDTGCGIPEDIINRIFDPFFTTKEVGKGTGLGLAMCYQNISQLGGFMKVYSEVGMGTVFNVYLPVEEDAAAETITFKGALPKGSGTILVIDDEAVMRTIAKGILEESGYEVILAHDGSDGLEAYEKNCDRIDLILLDMVMPRLNGRDTYQRLQQMGAAQPIILCSGFAGDRYAELISCPNIKTFVQKPYSAHDLVVPIYAALNSGEDVSAQSFNRVLLVEDDLAVRDTLQEQLQALGYGVDICADGEDAWRTFMRADHDYCAVITDIYMPVMDGLELAKRIRESGSSISILLISARNDRELVKDALRLHVDEFIDKPIAKGDLEAALKRVSATWKF